MRSLYRFIIRVSSFVVKELVEVLRQTPLILTLVLGPFLIMLLFGLGYRNRALDLKTLFVYGPQDSLSAQVGDFAKDLGPQLIYMGLESDKQVAFQRLRSGEVDVVVVIPDNALEMIRQREKVVVKLVHDEIDPYQVSYVQTFGNVYIDAINRRILASFTEDGIKEVAGVQQDLQVAESYASNMKKALQEGNMLKAQAEQQSLNTSLDSVLSVMQNNISLLNALGMPLADPSSSQTIQTSSLIQTLSDIQKNQETTATDSQANIQEKIDQLDRLQQNLDELNGQIDELKGLKPSVLVAPFANEVVNVNGVDLSPAHFFAPAVVILLLQHLAVTFAALTIVREQHMGMMELFRISPLNAFETLLGKYISYLVLGSVLAAAITAVMVFILNVPMVGAWLHYALVVVAMLFTSLGIGFLISMVAKTDLQAVQYAMFLLLSSVFFSGFFLDLRLLWFPIRTLSWALPATYGIRLLQNIMLKGVVLDHGLFYPLLGIGVFLFFLSWYFLTRRFRSEES